MPDLDYYVRVNHSSILGREQQVDWPSSWRVQSLGVGEWESLKGSLRSGYDSLRTSLSSLAAWGDDSVCDSIAIVAHTAYHLAAIRQIQRLLDAGSNQQSSARCAGEAQSFLGAQSAPTNGPDEPRLPEALRGCAPQNHELRTRRAHPGG